MSNDKSNKGVRYPDSKKRDVVEFIREYNIENGRGGLTTAVSHYGISAVTIRSWLKSIEPVDSHKSEKGDTLRKLAELVDEIDILQRQLSEKQKEYDELKKKAL